MIDTDRDYVICNFTTFYVVCGNNNNNNEMEKKWLILRPGGVHDEVERTIYITVSVHFPTNCIWRTNLSRPATNSMIYKPSGACVLGNVGGGVPRRQLIFINHHHITPAESRDERIKLTLKHWHNFTGWLMRVCACVLARTHVVTRTDSWKK